MHGESVKSEALNLEFGRYSFGKFIGECGENYKEFIKLIKKTRNWNIIRLK